MHVKQDVAEAFEYNKLIWYGHVRREKTVHSKNPFRRETKKGQTKNDFEKFYGTVIQE